MHEFHDRCLKGEELMVLKDMVLDVTEYKYNHPGGKFVLEKCVGRDISKFFDGGYSFE